MYLHEVFFMCLGVQNFLNPVAWCLQFLKGLIIICLFKYWLVMTKWDINSWENTWVQVIKEVIEWLFISNVEVSWTEKEQQLSWSKGLLNGRLWLQDVGGSCESSGWACMVMQVPPRGRKFRKRETGAKMKEKIKGGLGMQPSDRVLAQHVQGPGLTPSTTKSTVERKDIFPSQTWQMNMMQKVSQVGWAAGEITLLEKR